MVASSATATAGSSAAGSAWAMLPPIVPRLRFWMADPRQRLGEQGTGGSHLG